MAGTDADDQPVRLGAVLDWLREGKIDAQGAGERARTMKFPPPAEPSVTDRFIHDAHGEAAVHEPGSFAEVSLAHATGKIGRKEYEALAAGAAGALRAGR